MSSAARVVLASSNPGKLREMQAILAEYAIAVMPQSEFGVAPAEETGATFVENAILKARHAARLAGLPAIADDSGIEVDALGGRPGVLSARYAGPGADDRRNLELLIAELRATGELRPSARFHCVMVYMHGADDVMPIVAQGTWEGTLVQEPRGRNGFGYDPVFLVPTHGCTSAELPPEIKNRISHRALALRELMEKLHARGVLHSDSAPAKSRGAGG
jgi:XTP/dITP diphosphohydrolase